MIHEIEIKTVKDALKPLPFEHKEDCCCDLCMKLAVVEGHIKAIIERLLAARSQEAYDEMERVEKCGHLFANIQPNGCLVCKLLADEREVFDGLIEAVGEYLNFSTGEGTHADGISRYERLRNEFEKVNDLTKDLAASSREEPEK